VAISSARGLRVWASIAGLAHRIEHFGLPNHAHWPGPRLRIIATPQTIFPPASAATSGATYRRISSADLSGTRCSTPASASRCRRTPRCRGNPLLNQAAITGATAKGTIAADQAITAAEALSAYTVGGAVATGDDDNRGRIAPGQWADLAVLSNDPLATDPEVLDRIHVDMTLLAGRVVYER
jgi:predicted amidohydrolase YtcJ